MNNSFNHYEASFGYFEYAPYQAREYALVASDLQTGSRLLTTTSNNISNDLSKV